MQWNDRRPMGRMSFKTKAIHSEFEHGSLIQYIPLKKASMRHAVTRSIRLATVTGSNNDPYLH